MDDRTRRTTFFFLMVVFAVGWTQWLNYAYPTKKAGPNPAEAIAPPVAGKEAPPQEPAGNTEGNKGPAPAPVAGTAATKSAAAPATDNNAQPAVTAAPPAEPAVPLREDLFLGEDTPAKNANYFLHARFTNRGAAVTRLQINTYQNESRTGPFVLLHAETDEEVHPSYSLVLLKDPSLDTKTWEVVENTTERLVFRTTTLDGKLRIEKRFTLSPSSYVIKLQLAFQNLSDQPITATYKLLGGSGLPIEGKWYTRTFRSTVVAMSPPQGTPYLDEQPAATLVANDAKGTVTEYSQNPVQFAGVADQYFASLVIQPDEAAEKRTIANARAVVLSPGKESNLADVSVIVTGTPVEPPPGMPGEEVVVDYLLFNGPKESNILAKAGYHLDLVIHYPSVLALPIGPIARFLVGVLNVLYNIVHDYGVAIILMTLLVRACMFPLSFRQTLSMQKMQALQPHVQQIKDKFANDKERQNRELLDLYAKHKVNPLGGCLPILIQLPIFIGLWQALYNSFSLRHSTFLYGLTWIKDLSAPDQLFTLPAALPIIGEHINLLPILSTALMIVSMRMNSPPPTNPEMELQQKMMLFMSVPMGLLFYWVPAGLCVYFITTNAWSMLERRFLPKKATASLPAAAPPSTKDANARSWATPANDKKKPRR